MCQRVAPCLRATSDTWAPGSRLSATIRALSASERTRRPDGPSRTSSRLTGPTDEPSKWTSFLLSNPIPNLRPSRRLLRTFIRILKQGYRLRAYGQRLLSLILPRFRPASIAFVTLLMRSYLVRNWCSGHRHTDGLCDRRRPLRRRLREAASRCRGYCARSDVHPSYSATLPRA